MCLLSAHAMKYYHNLFQARQAGNHQIDFSILPSLVTKNMNDSLSLTPSEEEIIAATFNLQPSKSLGSDGFTGNFYRKFWHVVKEQLISYVKSFFINGVMPEGWNETHLISIPITSKPKAMNDFRPINRWNFRYKVISKITVSRIKRWMPTLTNKMQEAFTSGRLIQDNIMLVHEMLDNSKIGKQEIINIWALSLTRGRHTTWLIGTTLTRSCNIMVSSQPRDV